MKFVFVYGTLKEGGRFDRDEFRTHRLGDEPAHLPGAKLWDMGMFPSIERTGDENDVVYGELHGYHEKDWLDIQSMMDMIEGHRPDAPSHSLYNRSELLVMGDDSGVVEQATVYEITDIENRDKTLVESGVWEI